MLITKVLPRRRTTCAPGKFFRARSEFRVFICCSFAGSGGWGEAERVVQAGKSGSHLRVAAAGASRPLPAQNVKGSDSG